MLDSAESARRPYGRRTDAERNRETILDHAARLLVDDPAVGMDEIATAAGVGRATLTGTSPLARSSSRPSASAPSRRPTGRSTPAGSTRARPSRRSAGWSRRLFEVGDRYVFLLRQSTSHAQTEEGVTEAVEHIGARLVSFFERGQASGEFSRTLPATWMTGMTGLVIVAVAHSVMTGRLAADQSVDVAVETLLNGLTGSRR